MKTEITDDSPGVDAKLSPHIAETVQVIAQLHADHHLKSTKVENFVDRWTDTLGRPGFLVWAGTASAAWVMVNMLLLGVRYGAFDPPPFEYLQGILSALSLIVAVLILSTQRRSEQLAELREQMTLELASLTERKVTKVISLIEEQRRDSPGLKDRVDNEASEMIKRTDPNAMLGAIKDSHDEMMSKAGDISSN